MILIGEMREKTFNLIFLVPIDPYTIHTFNKLVYKCCIQKCFNSSNLLTYNFNWRNRLAV